jgi:DNA-binding PadR family transcriptional regulator
MTDPGVSHLLPLHARWYAILLALASGPRHGYGLMQMLEQDPTERWMLGPATLYRTLKGMERDGLITAAQGPDDSGGPPRRYYRLTALGQRAGEAEARRMSQLASRWGQMEARG